MADPIGPVNCTDTNSSRFACRVAVRCLSCARGRTGRTIIRALLHIAVSLAPLPSPFACVQWSLHYRPPVPRFLHPARGGTQRLLVLPVTQSAHRTLNDIEHMFYSVGRGSWSLAGASPLHGGVGRTVERVAHSGAFQSKRKITGKPREQRDTWREATRREQGARTMKWGLAGWRLRQQRTHGEGRQQSHSRPRVAQAAEAARVAQEGVGRSLGSATAGVGVMLTPVMATTAGFAPILSPAFRMDAVEVSAGRGLAPELVLATSRAAQALGRAPEEVWAEALRAWLGSEGSRSTRGASGGPGGAAGARPGRRSTRHCTNYAPARARTSVEQWPPFRWRREGGLALPSYPASISSVCTVESHVAPLALTKTSSSRPT